MWISVESVAMYVGFEEFVVVICGCVPCCRGCGMYVCMLIWKMVLTYVCVYHDVDGVDMLVFFFIVIVFPLQPYY